MSRKAIYWSCVGAVLVVFLAVFIWASQVTATRHSVKTSSLGKASDRSHMVASLKRESRVTLREIESADWEVDLSGLINLEHPRAKGAGLVDGAEPIKVYAYHLVHPKYGDFLIDTGVARQFAESPESEGVPKWLVPQLGFDDLSLLTATDRYLSEVGRPLKGVFLTHLHLDHISGLPAIRRDAPLYIGRGEASTPYFLHAFTRGTVDALLEGRPALQEWTAPIVDIFDDGSVYAIHSPGHTTGSTAFLVNTSSGPRLLTGDACHTAWGWQHQVEPGKFSMDQPQSRESLNQLLQLVAEHPEIEVLLGHQSL